MLREKTLAQNQLQLLIEIYKQHMLQKSTMFIDVDKLPNIPDRLKMLRKLAENFIVEYDEKNNQCKLKTGKTFFKSYLNKLCVFDKTHDLLSLVQEIFIDKTKKVNTLDQNDKQLISAAKSYVEDESFTGMGSIYITCLLTAIEQNTLKFTRQNINDKFGQGAFKGAGNVLKNDRFLIMGGFIEVVGTDGRGYRAPATYQNVYKIELDINVLELALFRHIISELQIKERIFTLPIEDVDSIYLEMKALATNQNEPRKHTPLFFKQSELRDAMFPTLVKTQDTLLGEVKKLTDLVTNSNDMLPVIQLLQSIQTIAGNEVKAILDKSQETKTPLGKP